MPGPSRPPSRRWRRPHPRRGTSAVRLPAAEALEPRLCFTTWYIAPDGSDIAPGTIDAPLASLSAAAQRARAGDTVLARGGTYDFNSTQTLNSIGAADGRITFQAFPGEVPVLDGGSTAPGAPLVRIGGQYLDFNDFQVHGANGVGILATGQHLQIIGNTIDKSKQQGVLVGTGGSLDATTDVIVQGNYITNSDLGPTSPPGSAGQAAGPRPAALEAYGASNLHFDGNYVHDNNGPGIEIVLATVGSASANVVHDNAGANLALDSATHVTVNQNFLYNTGETAYYTNGLPAASIQLSNGAYALSNPLDSLLIENNIALSSSGNLVYLNVRPQNNPDPGLKDSTVANNDFYSGGGTGSVNLQIDVNADHSNNLVADNIFDQTSGAQVLFRSGSGDAGTTTGSVAPAGFTFKYNNWYDGGQSVITHGGAPAVAGPGDVYSDPYFAGPGTIDPAGYKLLPNSPDVDAGVAVDGVASDFYGIPRPQNKAADIGAHEVVTTPPPPTGVQAPPGEPPGVPTGLTATTPSPYEIDLAWGDYTGPLAGFDIQRRGNGDWIPLGYSGAGPAADPYAVTGSFADTGLKPNHRYTYRVFAFFSDNTVSAYSKSFTFKTAKKPKLVKPPKPVKAPKAPKAVKAIAAARIVKKQGG